MFLDMHIKVLTPWVSFLKRTVDPEQINAPNGLFGAADYAQEDNELPEHGLGMPIVAGARVVVSGTGIETQEFGINECCLCPEQNSIFLSEDSFVHGMNYLYGIQIAAYGIDFEGKLGVGGGFDRHLLTFSFKTAPRPGGRSFKLITGMSYSGQNIWGEMDDEVAQSECYWLVKDGMYTELMRKDNMLIPVPGPFNRF